MVIKLNDVLSFEIAAPIVTTTPLRMYILIPNANADVIKNVSVNSITLDGCPLPGFDRIVAIKQIQNDVRISIGGDA